MNQVHILNGDALKAQFPPVIVGEKIVARECLVDGDVSGHSISELFESRANYLSQYDGITKQEYYQISASEFDKIQLIDKNSEIHCWFEQDLFCQVNFWFVLFLLAKRGNGQQIYFVGPNVGNEYSFGHMSQSELAQAYHDKTAIGDLLLTQLASFWPLYQSQNYAAMMLLAKQLPPSFAFIETAVQAQIDRMPDEQGLGKPERMLLAIMKKRHQAKQELTFPPVFRDFYEQSKIYSFGDIQVKRLFDDLLARYF